MWQDLLAALALLLVLEGILPFLNPAWWREALGQLLTVDERGLRLAGLISMLSGLALLYWVRG